MTSNSSDVSFGLKQPIEYFVDATLRRRTHSHGAALAALFAMAPGPSNRGSLGPDWRSNPPPAHPASLRAKLVAGPAVEIDLNHLRESESRSLLANLVAHLGPRSGAGPRPSFGGAVGRHAANASRRLW